jgi:putative redox protein
MARIAHAALDSATGYAANIRTGHHHLTADEPTAIGGTDTGPAPFQLLLAGLAACTSITLRMYADRKGWPLGAIHVELDYFKETDEAPAQIRRIVKFSEPLTQEQRARLAEIAEKTPVTKALKSGVPIETTFA